jgi:sugar-specific transcriptional regulator TrmB
MAEVKEILEEIGLTSKESQIYLSLLKLGEETASRISEVAQLNRVTCYSILKSMVEKGFCTLYEKNNIQYFKPIKPEQILGLLEEKKKKINEIIPILKEQETIIEEKPELMIFEGKKGMVSMFTLLLDDAEKKKEVFGYGNVSIAEKVIQHQSTFWRKTRLEKKIKMRAVSNSLGDVDHRSPPLWKKITEVRTNKDLEKLSFYTIITENYVSYGMFKGEIIGIVIKSKELVDKERFNFEMLWKASK